MPENSVVDLPLSKEEQSELQALASKLTFFGYDLKDLTREQLLIVIAYQNTHLRA